MTTDPGLEFFTAVASSGAPLPLELSWSGAAPPVLFAATDDMAILDLDDFRRPPEVPVVLDHDRRRVAGFLGRTAHRWGRLVARGAIFSRSPEGRFLLDNYQAGAPWRPSLGAALRSARIDRVEKGQVVTVNGRTQCGPLIVIKGWTLLELSITASAADEDASIVFDLPRPPVPEYPEIQYFI